eukprot:SAG31_NODE_1364_length_8625_cov_8.137696_4_plen_180_part_00
MAGTPEYSTNYNIRFFKYNNNKLQSIGSRYMYPAAHCSSCRRQWAVGARARSEGRPGAERTLAAALGVAQAQAMAATTTEATINYRTQQYRQMIAEQGGLMFKASKERAPTDGPLKKYGEAYETFRRKSFGDEQPSSSADLERVKVWSEEYLAALGPEEKAVRAVTFSFLCSYLRNTGL